MTSPESNDTARILQFPRRDTEGDEHMPSTDVDRVQDPTPDGPVLDGEIIDEEEYQQSKARRVAAVVVRQANVVRNHDVTSALVAFGRPALRHAVTVSQGHLSWSRRAIGAATHAHIREQIRLAHLAGDVEALAGWTDRLRAERDARHSRLRNLPSTLLRGLQALLVAVTVLAGVLVLAGIVFQILPGGIGWVGWWSLLGDLVGVAGVAVTIAVYALLYGAVPLWLWTAWREGRRAGAAPGWLVSPEQREQADTEITTDVIASALANLGIPAIGKFVKAGGRFEFVTPPRQQGAGTFTSLRLPHGVVAAKLTAKDETIELLAGNLGRFKHEVWPSISPEKGADARTLDLWVADKGALDRPVAASPMMAEEYGPVDVFRDKFPWGQTPRGDLVELGMLQRHWLVSGVSKQGKTATFRAAALWLALDPTTELQIGDLKGVGDWAMFEDLATILIQGQSEENEELVCAMLERAVVEMTKRMTKWRESGGKGEIPRELSRKKGSGFHPIYVIVDEVQVLYAAANGIGGSKDDARAWRAAKALHDQGRAVNVHLMQATQRPTDRTLPVLVREGAHIRASLFVPNIETARMALGDVADMGARPQSLRQGTDAGTVVLTGADDVIERGASHVIVRTSYISTKDGYIVAAKAKDIRARAGRAADTTPIEPAEVRELLVDVKRVMGGAEKLRSSELLQRLKERWPDGYSDWSAQQFASALRDPYGIEIRSGRVDGQGGQRYVLEDDVLALFEEQAKQTGGDGDER